MDEDAFDKIDQSLRGQMPDGYYIQWLITFNPWDASCFLKRKFFDEPDNDVLAMTTTYKCNEWLSEADLKMFERMKRTDPEQYKVAGEGDWGLAEGQFFKQWSNAKHVIEPFKIPREWVRIRAMDWGSARPYAVLWFAIDYDGNAYCYRELYGYGGKPNEGTGETAKEVAERIAGVETQEENVYGAILDNACWAATGVTGPTIAEELNDTLYEHHLPAFDKSSKGRIEGANAIKQRLIGNEVEDGTTKPALYFFNTCYHAIRTIPMLAHDKTKPEAYDTKGEDHCLVAGTCVTTINGRIPIENVSAGDYVLTRRGYRRVLRSWMTQRDTDVLTVMLDNGTELTGTGNHPVFVVGKGFVRIDKLTIGDHVFTEGGVLCQGSKRTQPTALYSAEQRPVGKSAASVVCCRAAGRRDVYNLEVDGVHEFFANGILVHNCADALAYFCLSRPWAPTKPKQQKPRDGYAKETKRSAWTY